MEPTSTQIVNEVERPSLTSSRQGIVTLETTLAILLLLFAVLYNLVRLYPEVSIQVPLLNDGVLHKLALERASAALANGQDPTDPWLATINLGYPLFHHYQHLAYVLPSLLSGLINVDTLFSWISYLLLSLFPLSIFWSMRRFGFSTLPAAFAGLAASLISTNGLYGFDFSSYVWRGYGMYTQLWGMFLLPLALAQGYATLKNGRGWFWTVLLMAATTLSHLVYGWISFISLALFALLPLLWKRAEAENTAWWWLRLKRLALIFLLVVLVTGYFLLPYLQDRAYMNRSIWEEQGKYDAYGYAWTLSALIHGELFDFGRFPGLTILAGIGLLVCLWRWREEHFRIPVILGLAWLLLYFGRPTWGALLNLIPLSQDLHFHRLIAGVHFAGILLAGLGMAIFWQWALAGKKAWKPAVTAVLMVALLLPVYVERGKYLNENTSWKTRTQAAITTEQEDFSSLVDTLHQLVPGRVYAGLGANWGKDYKIGDVPVYALLQSEGFDMLGYLYHALSLNADIQVLFDESREEQYNLFNVRYVVAPASQKFPDFVQLLDSFGRFNLYQVTTSGYFDLVGVNAAFVGDKSDFYPAASRWLSSDLPRLKEHSAIFLEGDAEGFQLVFNLSEAEQAIPLANFVSESSRGGVMGEVISNNMYATQVAVERESYLMLKASYDPNWQVSVDGEPAKTIMVMPSYVAVKVEPGIHQVIFKYQAQAWRGTLELGGLLVLGLIGIAEWQRKRLEGLVRAPGLAGSGKWIGAAWQRFAHWAPFAQAREHLRIHLPYLGVVFAFTLLAGLPLFQLKLMNGHDSMEYLPRLVEFFQALKSGQLFPQWAADFSAGYGQPFFIYNPPLVYYLASAWHALGFGLVAAENLACFLLLLLAGWGMYLLAGRFFSRLGGMVAGVAYLFAPYMLVNLYVRHALADFSAMAFLPWALWGLERFIRGNGIPSRLPGPFMIALLFLSSNSIALISAPVLLIFALWLAYTEHSERDLQAYWRGLACLGLGLGLSAFFWLPAVLGRSYVHVERLLQGYLSYTNHFVYLQQLVNSAWGYGLSLVGAQDGMSFATGAIYLLLVAVAILLVWRVHLMPGPARWLAGFSLLTLVLGAFFASTVSQWVWDKLPLLQYIEFPWRFLTLVALGTALLAGLPFALLTERPRMATLLAGLLVAGFFLTGFKHARPESFLAVNEADYTPQSIASQGISVTTAEEYEPAWVQQRPSRASDRALALISGDATWDVEKQSLNHYSFKVSAASPVTLQMNLFYFPSWRLTVDGSKRVIDRVNPQGLMQFNLEAGEHLVQLDFGSTPLRVAGIALAILSLALWGAALFWARKPAR